jgi:transcriptional regulator with XRE-family HTH domain
MNRTLGSEIRRLRHEAGLHQRDIAQRIQTTTGYVSQIEGDACSPPTEAKILAIAEILNVNVDHLLALAGRVPTDVAAIVRRNPKLWGVVRSHAPLR